MSRLDDRLTRELEQAARPASPAGAFEHVDRRRARRARLRKVQSGALIVVVLAGTVGGIAVLRNAFREPEEGIGDTPSVANGLIVYSEVRNAGQRLWAVQPDGTGARQLTTGDGGSDTGPAVSPDGRLIAFTRTNEQGSAVFVVGIDGAGLRRVTGQSWGGRDPAWSPDGMELVFAGDAGDGEGLYVMAPLLEGAAPHRITDSSLSGLSAETGPSWSPDGSTIVFAAGSPLPGVAEPINFDLFAAPADGSGPVINMTDTPDAAETAPAWSPDGSFIAFVRVPNTLDDTPAGGIATIRPEGSDLRILTDQHAFEQGPTWAPDGTVIAFQRDDPEGTSIYTIRPDGTELRKVTVGSDPAWQPLIESSSAPSPTSNPSPGNGQDLGLGFPVCNVSSVTGHFWDTKTEGTAYVATKMSDVGGCPQVEDAPNIVLIDLDGDGQIDKDYGPIVCEVECRVFSAPDLNRDGISEVLVVQRGGTELALGVFALTGAMATDALEIFQIEVAQPGDPEYGFQPGQPALLLVGGDAGNAQRLSCNGAAGQVLLVQSIGSTVPFDSPDAVLKIHEITFALDPDGTLHVLDSRDFEAPVGSPPFDEPLPTDVQRTFPCA